MTSDKNLNVLFLAPIPHPKNINAHPAPWIVALLKELVKQDIKVTVLNYSHLGGKKIERYNIEGIECIFIRTFHPKIDLFTLFLIRIFKMTRYINKVSHLYDLFYIFGNEHQYEFSLRKISKPKILHVQGIISECISYVRQTGLKKLIWNLSARYEKFGLKYPDLFVCKTHWDKSIIKKLREKSKIVIIPEILRGEFYENKMMNRGKNIIFIGGTNPIKGLEFALLAFSTVYEQIDANLIIIGNTNSKLLDDIISKYKLDFMPRHRIIATGMLNATQIVSYFVEAFCLLHTSKIDNSPNSICEAQMVGLPVIATNVGGVSSLIENQQTGILVNFDIDQIADKIMQLKNNSALWNIISEKSRAIALKRHDRSNIIKTYIDLFSYHIDAK